MHVGVPHCTGQDTTKCAPGSSQLHGLAGIAQQFRLGKGLATPAPCPLHIHPVLVLYWMHLYVPELQ